MSASAPLTTSPTAPPALTPAQIKEQADADIATANAEKAKAEAESAKLSLEKQKSDSATEKADKAKADADAAKKSEDDKKKGPDLSKIPLVGGFLGTLQGGAESLKDASGWFSDFAKSSDDKDVKEEWKVLQDKDAKFMDKAMAWVKLAVNFLVSEVKDIFGKVGSVFGNDSDKVKAAEDAALQNDIVQKRLALLQTASAKDRDNSRPDKKSDDVIKAEKDAVAAIVDSLQKSGVTAPTVDEFMASKNDVAKIAANPILKFEADTLAAAEKPKADNTPAQPAGNGQVAAVASVK